MDKSVEEGTRLSGDVTVAVLGASGYTGGQVVRLLLDHPHVELKFISGESSSGQQLATVHPWMQAHPESSMLSLQPLSQLPEVDVTISCLPNGKLPEILDLVEQKSKVVINVSGDYRMVDHPAMAQVYPTNSTQSEQFQYFVPDLMGQPSSRFISLPGCMAVASLYATWPLISAGLLEPSVVIDAKTGSSGGGKNAIQPYSERFANFRPHKVHGHRHGYEIAAALETFCQFNGQIQFSSYSLPVSRGILVSCYSQLKPKATYAKAVSTFIKSYQDTPFVNFKSGRNRTLPQLADVIGANVAEVSLHVSGRSVVSICSLDNLLKGAAGQAVQTLNMILSVPPETSLPLLAVGF